MAVPVILGEHRGHDALEFRQLRGGGHGFAKFAVDSGVTHLVGSVFSNRTARTHHADDERQLGRLEVPPHVADEMREIFAVGIITARLAAGGISAAVDHVVPALKPHEPRQFVAGLGIVRRVHALDIAEHLADMPKHEPVKNTSSLSSFPAFVGDVLSAFLKILDLFFIKLVWPCTRWPEVRV